VVALAHPSAVSAQPAAGPTIASQAAAPLLQREATLAAAGTVDTGGRFGDNGLIPFGDAPDLSPSGSLPSLSSPAVGMAVAPSGDGIWVTSADGGLVTYGDAVSHGSLAGRALTAPIVGITSTPDGAGYWMVALGGAVYGFGSARLFGSMAGRPLNSPIVDLASTPDGDGYWEVAADGGMFAFGDARFLGSMGGTPLVSPVIGMAATADGEGYWEVAADGGVFAFGDAKFYGSLGGLTLTAPVLSVAPTPDRRGYWLSGADGAIYSFGDAVFRGGNNSEVPTPTIAAVATTPDGGGYWLLDPATIPTTFAAATGAQPAATIISVATSQLGGNRRSGSYCNLYGPCEEWCALFATWAWEQAGIEIPRYAFVGDIYYWAGANTALLAPDQMPAVGDLVLYGTGPANAATSVHVAIVADVWPDGAIVTIDGDAPPGPPGSTNVVTYGPFVPSDSEAYNGFPIYAYAVP